MGYLLTQIFWLVLIAFAVGLATGWISSARRSGASAGK